MSRLSAPLISLVLGVLLALTMPPLPTGLLTPVVLAVIFLHVTGGPGAGRTTPKTVASRLFWTMTAMNTVHLWWLTAFLGKIFGVPALGALAFALFALEGSFYALLGYLVARVIQTPLGRVWGLAGGWLLLEQLRFLGSFAFPWPTLGYSLLSTPMIQIADLGGITLCSALVTLSAAALVSFWQGRAAPLWLTVLCWLAALSYGVTRQPAQGLLSHALVQRSTLNPFDKALRRLSAEQQLALYNQLTRPNLRPGEVPIWTETAIQDPSLLPQTPAGGIYGVSGGYSQDANRAVAWDGRAITTQNDKARPVPFGEFFPLRRELDPAWRIIEQATNSSLESLPPAQTLTPLSLGGVLYGAYVCYDSVFPWVASELTKKGAGVLVNISNDSWYAGWGVQQHFMMGRVRAIENRRWLLRSVNLGIAGSVNDLGQPQQLLSQGQGVIHVTFPVLRGQTVFNRVGGWPTALLALIMLGYGRLRRFAAPW